MFEHLYEHLFEQSLRGKFVQNRLKRNAKCKDFGSLAGYRTWSAESNLTPDPLHAGEE